MTNSMVIETFVKNFNVNTDLTDVKFRKFSAEPYHSLDQDRRFGEKICLLYNADFTVFNIDVSLKVLSFAYEAHAEALKLEINVHNELLTREIASCKNFLQRKRNMNLTFEVLIKFVKLFEMRRLICQTVFQKQPNVSTIVDDGGITVKCCNENFSITYLELNWTISWNVDTYEVSDFIEFYCNYLVLNRYCGNNIKEKLEVLVQPSFDFQSKLKLWKLLMKDLYGSTLEPQASQGDMAKVTDILEILDSDSDESVIEVDRNVIEIDRNISNGPVNDDILVIE